MTGAGTSIHASERACQTDTLLMSFDDTGVPGWQLVQHQRSVSKSAGQGGPDSRDDAARHVTELNTVGLVGCAEEQQQQRKQHC